MKLHFNFDGIVDGKVIYPKNQIHDIPVEKGSALRWIKRGAIEVLDAVESLPVDQAPVIVEVVAVESPEVEIDLGLDALGGEEEVVIEDDKKENKRVKKSTR